MAVFALRLNKMSNTEFLLYSITCLPFASQLAWIYTRYDDSLMLSVLLISVPAYFYYRWLKKRISSFSITQLFFGFLALIFYMLSAVSIIFFSFGIGILELDKSYAPARNFGSVGATVGLAGGIALSVMLIKIWRQRVSV